MKKTRAFYPIERFIFFAVALLLSTGAVSVHANDAAGESAAGGLQLKSEPRVSMVKERLYIGKIPTKNATTMQSKPTRAKDYFRVGSLHPHNRELMENSHSRFELIVERPEGQYVSFCWDGTVEKISETKFRASAKNLVPKRELLVYFLRMEE